MATLLKNFAGFPLFGKYLKHSADRMIIPQRHKKLNPPPRYRHPEWLPKVTRVLAGEHITSDNKKFLQEVVESKFLSQDSPLMDAPIEPSAEWTEKSRRTGLIAKKIGLYPMWLKNGKKVMTTLLQVDDNQVIKYMSPEEYTPVKPSKYPQVKRKLGCLVVGSENINPQLITKEYYGVFKPTGVPPKRLICRFTVSPDAALEPGTPLFASHFKPGEVLDIKGKTVDRGFQGVMKRWGFKGMPATHGVTKTHRRGGNIGSGGKMARVMPGTKMPGHMGNSWRILRGVRILRVNTKYNVIWVLAHNIPGEMNNKIYLYDTLLPLRKNTSPYFPTYLPGATKEPLPEDLYADDVQPFTDPTIEFKPES